MDASSYQIPGRTGRFPEYSFIFLIIIILSLFTCSRNSIWHDDIVLWQGVVNLSASKGRPLNDLAMAEFRAGRVQESILTYKKALALGEGLPMVHSNLGVAYTSIGLFAEAADQHALAIELNATYAPAYTNLGIAYSAMGRADDALTAFSEAFRLTGNPREQHNLANALHRAGRLDGSIKAFRALLRASRAPSIYNDLGLVLAARGDYRAAMAGYERALELDPAHVNSLINIAGLYMRQGDTENALKRYDAALLLAPDHAILHYHLGLFYERADNDVKARKHYDRFLALAGVKERKLVRSLHESFKNGDL